MYACKYSRGRELWDNNRLEERTPSKRAFLIVIQIRAVIGVNEGSKDLLLLCS